jgi:hypothetical protein
MNVSVRARFGLGSALLVALSTGCVNTPLYFDGPQPILAAAGNDDPLPGNGLTLRFRNPTADEKKNLDAQSAALGFKVPWIQRDHVHLELTYLVTNTSDPPATGDFNLMVDGANEFTKYDVTVTASALQQGNNDPPTYLPLMSSSVQTLAPRATYSGLIREDDFAEAELDLDALGRWLGPGTFAGVLINLSSVNPVGLEMVPRTEVVPALIEVDVHLQSSVAMTVNYVLRVRDDNDQLLHDSGDTLYQTTPTLFQPPAMM